MKPLTGCKDAASLDRAIQELCTELGIVARVDIRTLVKSGKRQALCFLRIDSAGQEEQLMRTFGLTRCGNDLLLIADLQPEIANAKASVEQTAITDGMTPSTTAASSTIQPMQAR